MSLPPRPTFLVLGGVKCATTFLHRCLARHPQVLGSRPKETHFFDLHFHRGLDHYREAHFGHWTGQPALGESCPTYLMLPFVRQRVRECLPEARLVAVLRDPARRAFSHWYLERCLGREPLPFREALEVNLEQWTSSDTIDEAAWKEARSPGRPPGFRRSYLEGGLYARWLQEWGFRDGRLKAVLFEDLTRHPDRTLAEVWAFLGLDPAALDGDGPGDENVALGPAGAGLRRWLERAGLDRLVPPALGRAARRLLLQVDPPPRLQPADRAWLEDFYRPHDRALAGLLGRAPDWGSRGQLSPRKGFSTRTPP